jgi:hypothetical protein
MFSIRSSVKRNRSCLSLVSELGGLTLSNGESDLGEPSLYKEQLVRIVAIEVSGTLSAGLRQG